MSQQARSHGQSLLSQLHQDSRMVLLTYRQTRVLLALLARASPDPPNAVHTTIGQLAVEARIDRRAAQRCLRFLEALGLVRCELRKGRGKVGTIWVLPGSDGDMTALLPGQSNAVAQTAFSSSPTPLDGENAVTDTAFSCGALVENAVTGTAFSGSWIGENAVTKTAFSGENAVADAAFLGGWVPPSPHTPLPPLQPSQVTQAVEVTLEALKRSRGEEKRKIPEGPKGFPKESAASGPACGGQMALPLQGFLPQGPEEHKQPTRHSPPGPPQTGLEGGEQKPAPASTPQDLHGAASPPPAGPQRTGLEGRRLRATPAALARELRGKWSGLDPDTALRAVKAAASQGRGTQLVAEVIADLDQQACPADPVARLVALCQHAMRVRVKRQEEQAALEALPEPLRGAIAEFARRQALPVVQLASEAAAMLCEVQPDRLLAAIGAADRTGWEAWRQVKLAARDGKGTRAEGIHPELGRLREVFAERYRAKGMLLPWDPSRDDARASQLLRWLSEGGVEDPVEILRSALARYFGDEAAEESGYPLEWFWQRAARLVNVELLWVRREKKRLEEMGKLILF